MLGSGGAKRLGSTGRAAGVRGALTKRERKTTIFGDIPSGKLT